MSPHYLKTACKHRSGLTLSANKKTQDVLMRTVIDVWVTPGNDPTNDNVTHDRDWSGNERCGRGREASFKKVEGRNFLKG